MCDDGALDPEMEIPGWIAVFVLHDVMAANINSAGKTEFSVDDEELSMIAQVQGHKMRRKQRGVKTSGSEPGLAEAPLIRGRL